MDGFITTIHEKCVACNKCIAKCPVRANEYIQWQGKSVVTVNADKCIGCGECIRHCDHNARDYIDDTEEFFEALARGESITVIAAPSVRHNFRNYKNLFAMLKKAGVDAFYDVSFGADITTWAYLRAIKEQKLKTVIAQPCPVVVAYILRYREELAKYLAPVHSPAMCAAIYLRSYGGVTNKLAFLSPCIAKKNEFADERCGGVISYNITFEKLKEKLKAAGYAMGLEEYGQVDFSGTPCDLGFTYSRPGGLRENVEFFEGTDVWVRQVEGIAEDIEYFDKFEARLKTGKEMPVLVDVLNCKHGCNMGTGADPELDIDDVDRATNAMKKQFSADAKSRRLLADRFDKELRLEDFMRDYRHAKEVSHKAEERDIEKVFAELGKVSALEKMINCYSCGYGNCREFAEAVALGLNTVENCKYYAKTKLASSDTELNKLFESLDDKMEEMETELKGMNRSAKRLGSLSQQTHMISFNASIQAARAGQEGKVFTVVASEIRKLSEQSAKYISETQANETSLETKVTELKELLGQVEQSAHNLLE